MCLSINPTRHVPTFPTVLANRTAGDHQSGPEVCWQIIISARCHFEQREQLFPIKSTLHHIELDWTYTALKRNTTLLMRRVFWEVSKNIITTRLYWWHVSCFTFAPTIQFNVVPPNPYMLVAAGVPWMVLINETLQTSSAIPIMADKNKRENTPTRRALCQDKIKD